MKWQTPEFYNEKSEPPDAVMSEPRDWFQEINRAREEKRLKRNYFISQREHDKSNELSYREG